MISKKTKYALKAVIFLATRYFSGEPVLIAEIAQKESIPKKFLEAILLELKNKGILQSRKGKGGGYFLAKDPKQISFGEVLRIFEDPFVLLPCVKEGQNICCEECQKGTACGIHMVMQEVYNTTSNILNIITLQEVCDRMRNVQQEVMYFI